jgi:hypothetical protein
MPGIATKARCVEGQKKPTSFWLYKSLVMFGADERRGFAPPSMV